MAQWCYDVCLNTMLNQAQHWQTRTPIRVRVLGLLFFVLLIAMLGLLWRNWGYSLWVYSPIGVFLLLALTRALWSQPRLSLFFDENNGFCFVDDNITESVSIAQFWYSPFAISLTVIVQGKTRLLVFWRSALTPEAWRQLHLQLLRYQLQYQFADYKGAP